MLIMGTSFLNFCFQIVISLVFMSNAHADTTQESYCRPEDTTFKFWNCRGTTAIFDAKAHQRVRNACIWYNFFAVRINLY